MRLVHLFLTLLILAAYAHAQEPSGEDGAEGKEGAAGGEAAAGAGEEGEKAEKKDEPKEPPKWNLPDRDRRRLERYIERYLVPGRRERSRTLERIERLAERDIDGHHFLEDVDAITDIANHSRTFNPKAGRRGRIEQIDVSPDVHGFPGGIGTVRYYIRLPRRYTDRELWPLIFALPDNKEWPDGEKYIEEVWAKSEKIAENYIIVVPRPHSKGDRWTRRQSYARAMIALRHVTGKFDQEKDTGGPATDMLRIFLDGRDAAAIALARFPGMFAGAVLRHSDGRIPGGPNLRETDAPEGVSAYVVYSPKKRFEKQFAQGLKALNDTVELVEDEGEGIVDVEPIAAWLKKTAEARVTQPRSIDYTIHDPSFQRAWWLTVLRYDSALEPPASISARADRARNVVRVEVRGVSRFEINLNDAIIDLNRPLDITVVEGEREYPFLQQAELARSVAQALTSLVQSNHPWRVYPVRLTVDVPKLRAAWKAAEEKKAAAEEKEKEKKKTSVEVVSGAADVR